MRRWNGWGDDAVLYPAPESAVRFIEKLIGPGRPTQDVTAEHILRKIPASRMPEHALVTTDPLRGSSMPADKAPRIGSHYAAGVWTHSRMG